MNRLAVYSYLTRYAHGHAGSGSRFTEPLAEKSYECLLLFAVYFSQTKPGTGFRGTDN